MNSVQLNIVFQDIILSDLSYLDKPLKHQVTNLGGNLSKLIGIMNLGNEINGSPDQGNYEISDNWFKAKRLL